jgi:predicted Rossmann-fold nucleotide-binding protein
MGEMRNALIVRAAGAVVAVGGGHGTLSEVALALRIGTPVAGLQDRFSGAVTMPRLETPAAASAWAIAQASR